jgi:hypothetical protein
VSPLRIAPNTHVVADLGRDNIGQDVEERLRIAISTTKKDAYAGVGCLTTASIIMEPLPPLDVERISAPASLQCRETFHIPENTASKSI